MNFIYSSVQSRLERIQDGDPKLIGELISVAGASLSAGGLASLRALCAYGVSLDTLVPQESSHLPLQSAVYNA